MLYVSVTAECLFLFQVLVPRRKAHTGLGRDKKCHWGGVFEMDLGEQVARGDERAFLAKGTLGVGNALAVQVGQRVGNRGCGGSNGWLYRAGRGDCCWLKGPCEQMMGKLQLGTTSRGLTVECFQYRMISGMFSTGCRRW